MDSRPVTTLFMLMSVDGKISTGVGDDLDFDADLIAVPGIKEGLHQYYEIEQTTDLWSLNSGRVMEKMGVNTKPLPDKTAVSYVLLDNHHLMEQGIRYFSQRAKELVLVTSNPGHPVYNVKNENIHVLFYEQLDPAVMLADLKSKFGCQRITVQTGGTLNGLFLRQKLFDYVDVVVAPALVGGRAVPTLIDGQAITDREHLADIGVLQVERVDVLADSYIRLRYRVTA